MQVPGTQGPARRALVRIDPGWLFLIAGIVIIAAVVLIPAQHDLDDARWQRDRAIAIERHRLDRLDRYGAYLAALRDNDEVVLLSLAATQLNMSPENRVPIQPLADISQTSASVFPALEPEPLTLPPQPARAQAGRADQAHHGGRMSLLERLSITSGTRLWLIAAGVLCILFGLLPATSAVVGSATSGAMTGAAAMAGTVYGAAQSAWADRRGTPAEENATSEY